MFYLWMSSALRDRNNHLLNLDLKNLSFEVYESLKLVIIQTSITFSSHKMSAICFSICGSGRGWWLTWVKQIALWCTVGCCGLAFTMAHGNHGTMTSTKAYPFTLTVLCSTPLNTSRMHCSHGLLCLLLVGAVYLEGWQLPRWRSWIICGWLHCAWDCKGYVGIMAHLYLLYFLSNIKHICCHKCFVCLFVLYNC